MSRPKSTSSTHWLVKSMDEPMQRVAALLIALSLTMCLLLVMVTYFVGSWSAANSAALAANPTAVSTTDPNKNGTSTTSNADVQLIEEDAVPLAASPQGAQDDDVSIPTFVVLGACGGIAVAYFAVRIRRVNTSITDMNRKLH